MFYQRGIAHERLKEWDQAEPNFKKALELYPDQPQVLNYLGYSWVDRGENLDEALLMIKKAVELRPQDGYIVDSLGWAYYQLGRYPEAVVELEKPLSCVRKIRRSMTILVTLTGVRIVSLRRRSSGTMPLPESRSRKNSPRSRKS